MGQGTRERNLAESHAHIESIVAERLKTFGHLDGAEGRATGESPCSDGAHRGRDDDRLEGLATGESAVGDIVDRRGNDVTHQIGGFGVEQDTGLILIEKDALGSAESCIGLIDRDGLEERIAVVAAEIGIDLGDRGGD